MQFLSIFQVVADVLILVLILFYFYKRKEDRMRDKILEVRAREMLVLNKTMDALIKEAQKTTENLVGTMESGQSDMKKLMDDIEEKKEGILQLLSEQIQPDEPEIEGEVKEIVVADEREEDKYAEAARLAEEGLPPDEIARLVNLSRGEVELILDLKK